MTQVAILYLGRKYYPAEFPNKFSYEHNNIYRGLKSFCAKRDWWMHGLSLEEYNWLNSSVKDISFSNHFRRDASNLFFYVPTNTSLDIGLEELLRIKNAGFVCYLWICDDQWVEDNECRSILDLCDYVCTTSRIAYEHLTSNGYICRPMLTQYAACSQELRKACRQPKMYDVSFVGQETHYRCKLVQSIRDAGFSCHTFGRGWAGKPKLPEDGAFGVYRKSRINLSLPNMYDEVVPRIKGRIFEIASVGGLVLTRYSEDIQEYYEIEKEIWVFENFNECTQKIKVLLSNPSVARRIASSMRLKTLLEHTWESRFQDIFIDFIPSTSWKR